MVESKMEGKAPAFSSHIKHALHLLGFNGVKFSLDNGTSWVKGCSNSGLVSYWIDTHLKALIFVLDLITRRYRLPLQGDSYRCFLADEYPEFVIQSVTS